MGNPPFEDVSPVKKGGFIAMLVYQRVVSFQFATFHPVEMCCVVGKVRLPPCRSTILTVDLTWNHLRVTVATLRITRTLQ